MWQYLWIGGRSTRLEWWIVHIGVTIALPIVGELFLAARRGGIGPHGVVQTVWLGVSFLLLWISFASIVRRLHDRNKSGWWSLLYLPPFVGWVWFFIECGFLPGRAPPMRPEAGTIERLPAWRPTLKGTLKLAGVAAALVLFVMFWRVWVPSGDAKVGTFNEVTKSLNTPATQTD